MRDLRSEPVRRMAALGESTTWGYSASRKEKCWVNLVRERLEEFQGRKVELFNQGIGSNVLTPLCPSYGNSARPCGLERVERDVIALRPDLVTISYGLNDARGGTDIRVFRSEYQRLIDQIRAGCGAVIVLVGMYAMHDVFYTTCEGWNESSPEIAELFDRAVAQLAEENGLPFADIYPLQRDVPWLVDPDHCHPNDLGHRLIADRVFAAIARSCSFVARTQPREPSVQRFSQMYGNGPDGARSC